MDDLVLIIADFIKAGDPGYAFMLLIIVTIYIGIRSRK